MRLGLFSIPLDVLLAFCYNLVIKVSANNENARKAAKRTPLKYSVSRNIRQNRDNTDKALLLFGSAEVTGPIPVSSLESP